MPVAASWMDPEESIVLIDYQGNWTWEEARVSNEQGAQMAASKTYRCDVIGNMRPGSMESIGSAISIGRKIVARYPDNVGLIVVITNPLISTLATIFKGFDTRLGAKIYPVTTMEQARNVISQARSAER